jgi:glycosyltransferase involved in cell wall biosynthesis
MCSDDRPLLVVCESLKGGLGAAAVRAASIAADAGRPTMLVSFAHVEGAHIPPGVTFVPIRMPRAWTDSRTLLSARRVVVNCWRELRLAHGIAPALEVHGVRCVALLPISGLSTAVLTYHGATVVDAPLARRLIEALTFRLLPRLLGGCQTVLPLSIPGWRFIWLDSPRRSDVYVAAPPSGRLQLLWASRVSRQKKFQDFVDLVTVLHHRGVPVVGWVAGGGDEIQKWQTVDAGSVPIEFLGHVSDVGELLSLDVVVCLFSHYEGRPFILEEALSYGRPIIASDLPGTRLLVSDRKFLVASVAGAADLAQKLQDPLVRRGVGERLRADSLKLIQQHKTVSPSQLD